MANRYLLKQPLGKDSVRVKDCFIMQSDSHHSESRCFLTCVTLTKKFAGLTKSIQYTV